MRKEPHFRYSGADYLSSEWLASRRLYRLTRNDCSQFDYQAEARHALQELLSR